MSGQGTVRRHSLGSRRVAPRLLVCIVWGGVGVCACVRCGPGLWAVATMYHEWVCVRMVLLSALHSSRLLRAPLRPALRDLILWLWHLTRTHIGRASEEGKQRQRFVSEGCFLRPSPRTYPMKLSSARSFASWRGSSSGDDQPRRTVSWQLHDAHAAIPLATTRDFSSYRPTCTHSCFHPMVLPVYLGHPGVVRFSPPCPATRQSITTDRHGS